MCVYIYIYIYMCVCVCVCIYIYIYIYLFVYLLIPIYVYVWIYIYIYLFVSFLISKYIYIYIYIYIHIYIHVCVHIYTTSQKYLTIHKNLFISHPKSVIFNEISWEPQWFIYHIKYKFSWARWNTNCIYINIYVYICVHVCVFVYIYIYIYIYIDTFDQPFGIMVRVFLNGSGDQGSIPGCHTKDSKIVLDVFSFKTQHYKVWIKAMWSITEKVVVLSPTFWCCSYWNLWVAFN